MILQLILVAKSTPLDSNMLIQYTLCSVALLGALIWIVVKAVRAAKRKEDAGSCCGCTLSATCQSAKKDKDENKGAPKRDCHQ